MTISPALKTLLITLVAVVFLNKTISEKDARYNTVLSISMGI